MTLDDGVTTITLNDFEWVNQYEWSDIKQQLTRTVGGGIVIEETSVSVGRPIVISSGESVWITKSVLDPLIVLIDTIDKTYTLTLDDASTITVMFDRSSGSPYSAKPVWRKNVQLADDYFTLTLRLIKV